VKYNTLTWVLFWGAITIIMANLGTCWGLIISGITLLFVIFGIALPICQSRRRLRKIKNVGICYLIPQKEYPNKTYNDAPTEEKKPSQLTIGMGTYQIMNILTPKIDMLIDYPVLSFEGDSKNRPENLGVDNPFVVDELDDGSYKDWWGNIQPISEGWPRYLHNGYNLVISNRIKTKGEWSGSVCFEVLVRDGPIVVKKLDLRVSSDMDEISFLRVNEEQKPIRRQSPINIATPGSEGLQWLKGNKNR
jgi:hypothetical protein